jgi:hypothetical protein
MPRGRSQRQETSRVVEPECGRVIGRLCSDLFQERYDIDRVKAILLNCVSRYRFHEFFDELPRDREDPRYFDPKAFHDYATGIREHVYEELKKRESDPNYTVRHLNALALSIIEVFLTRASKAQQEIHTLKVNKKMLEKIRGRLMKSDITLEDLALLSVKPVPKEAQELNEKLKSCPGFRHAWFKKKREKGQYTLYLCKTGKDVEEEYELLTRPRRDPGHRRHGSSHNGGLSEEWVSEQEQVSKIGAEPKPVDRYIKDTLRT